MSFTDKTLVCRDCDTTFTFTSGEQEFYEQKGFTNEPTRCPNCRQSRKQNRSGGSDSYGSRDSYSSGGRSSYSSGGGYGDRAPREMHETTCSGCGKSAQVPFVPRGDKPVYCSDCFKSQRAPRSNSGSRW